MTAETIAIKLINDEPVSQVFKIDRSFSLHEIRPNMYIQGPLTDGELHVTITHANGDIFSDFATYDDINSVLSDNYNIGMLRMELEQGAFLALDENNLEEEYTIVFEIKNHTDDDDIYVSLVKPHENLLYPVNGIPVGSSENPIGIEFGEFFYN